MGKILDLLKKIFMKKDIKALESGKEMNEKSSEEEVFQNVIEYTRTNGDRFCLREIPYNLLYMTKDGLQATLNQIDKNGISTEEKINENPNMILQDSSPKLKCYDVTIFTKEGQFISRRVFIDPIYGELGKDVTTQTLRDASKGKSNLLQFGDLKALFDYKSISSGTKYLGNVATKENGKKIRDYTFGSFNEKINKEQKVLQDFNEQELDEQEKDRISKLIVDSKLNDGYKNMCETKQTLQEQMDER